MPDLTRSELLAKLEDDYSIRLSSADAIHEVDLAEICDVLIALQLEVWSYRMAMDDYQHAIAHHYRIHHGEEIDG
jgi:hypothetical protein